jgi:hypothetical protein
MSHPEHPSQTSSPSPGVRGAAALAYLSVACPARYASLDNPAAYAVALESEWHERANSLVDQLASHATPAWRDRPEIEGWPATPAPIPDLVESVLDDLVELWRPPPEPPAEQVCLPPIDDGEFPSESDRWEWVLAHVGLAQATGLPLSTFLGPSYLDLWDRMVCEHPRLAGLYRPHDQGT